MQESLNYVLLKVDLRSGLLRELLALYEAFPEFVIELSNQLPIVLSPHPSIDVSILPDYLTLCNKVLDCAETEPKFLLTIHLFRILLPEAYNSAHFPKVLATIQKACTFLKIALEDSISLPEPLYNLTLVQAMNLHAKHLSFNEKAENPFLPILGWFVESGKIREADWYFIKPDNSFKEWIGYLFLLKDIRENLKETSIGDLIASVLFNQFCSFMSDFLSDSVEEQKGFEWVNSLIVYIGIYAEEVKANSRTLTRIIRRKYTKPYKRSEGFKNAFITQGALLKTLKIYPKLKFYELEDRRKKQYVETCPDSHPAKSKDSSTVIPSGTRLGDTKTKKSETTNSKNEACTVGEISEIFRSKKTTEPDKGSEEKGRNVTVSKIEVKTKTNLKDTDLLFNYNSINNSFHNFGESGTEELNSDSNHSAPSTVCLGLEESKELSQAPKSLNPKKESKVDSQAALSKLVRENLVSCKAGIVKPLDKISATFIRKDFNAFVQKLDKEIVAEQLVKGKEFFRKFKSEFVNLINKHVQKREFPKFSIHPFPNSSLKRFGLWEEPTVCINVHCSYNPKYILEKITRFFAAIKVRPFEENPHFLELITKRKLYKYPDPRYRYFLPFLKFTTHSYDLSANIFVNHLAPCFSAVLIEKYFEFDSRVGTIANFILRWAKAYGILEPDKGYLSSYAITLLVIFFLQIIGQPVLESIQKYATSKGIFAKTKEIPSFQETLKREVNKGEEMKYSPENIKTTLINIGFKAVDLKEMKDELGYPKNDSTPGELIALFFYYFGFEYPKMTSSDMIVRKMSIREGKYLNTSTDERRFAFCIEDPIDITFNPAYTVLKDTQEYEMITYKFQKAYQAITNRDLSSVLDPFN